MSKIWKRSRISLLNTLTLLPVRCTIISGLTSNLISFLSPTIAKLFRYVGIAENAGYGMNKLASWETLTGTKPTIESERTIATVSFPLKSAIKRTTEASDVGKNVGKNVGKTLTDRQQKILELVTDDPTISLAEMAEIIGVTTRTIEREIPKMENIIRHVGPKNGGSWEII